MIKSFKDALTEDAFNGVVRKGFPADLIKVARRKLRYVHAAHVLADLRVPPGNRLHELERDRKGQHSISVNDQWRICFRFVDGDAYDVEITDYH